MKKTWILLIFGLILLSGCNTTTKNNISESEFFEKKQECAKYKDAIQKEVNNSLIRDDDQYFSYDVQIRDIFYSPVENSCLYGVYYIYQDKSDPKDTCGTYVIQDYLSNNDTVGTYMEIKSTPTDENPLSYTCLWDKSEEQYDKAVKELKGE